MAVSPETTGKLEKTSGVSNVNSQTETVAFTVRVDTEPTANEALFGFFTSSSGRFNFVLTPPGTAGFVLRIFRTFSGSNGLWDTTSDLSLDTDYSIVVKLDSTGANDPTVWVNGSTVSLTTSSTPSGTGATDADAIRIFRNASDGQQNTSAEWLADVAYYNALLSDDLCESLSNGIAPDVHQEDRQFYVKLNEASGTNADEEDQGADLTASNIAWVDHPSVIYKPRRRAKTIRACRPVARWLEPPFGQVFSSSETIEIGVYADHYKHTTTPPTVDYNVVALNGSYSGSDSTGNNSWTTVARYGANPTQYRLLSRSVAKVVHTIGSISIDMSQFDTQGKQSLECTVTAKDGGKKHKGSVGGGIGLDAFTFFVDTGTLESQEVWVDATNGLDTNDGTEGSPLLTMGKAYEVLIANHSGSTLDNCFIYLEPGTYDPKEGTSVTPSQTMWCTVRPAEGHKKNDCEIRQTVEADMPSDIWLKFVDVKLTATGTNSTINNPSGSTDGRLWFDDCHFETDETTVADITDEIVKGTSGSPWAYLGFTNCTAQYVRSAFEATASSKQGADLVCNCAAQNVASDFTSHCPVVVNGEGLDIVGGGVGHPDFWQWNTTTVVYDVIIVNGRSTDIESVGILFQRSAGSGKICDGVSIRNFYMDVASSGGAGAMGIGESSLHVIIRNVTARSPNFRSTFQGPSEANIGFGPNTDQATAHKFIRVEACACTHLAIRGKNWNDPGHTNEKHFHQVTVDNNCSFHEESTSLLSYKFHSESSPAVGTNWILHQNPVFDDFGSPISTTQEVSQAVVPNAIESSTNLTGAITDIDDDPDVPDGNWMTATADDTDTDVRVSFPTPPDSPKVGADLQTFQAWVRESNSGATGVPQVRIELWENGSLVRAGSNSTFTVSGELISFTWNANELGTADGSLVECKVVGTTDGVSPNDNSVDVGAVEWIETVDKSSPLLAQVTQTFPIDAAGRTRPIGANAASIGAYEEDKGEHDFQGTMNEDGTAFMARVVPPMPVAYGGGVG